MKSLVEQIETLIRPSIEAMGFELVQVRFLESKHGRRLEVMAERADGSMTLDDCAMVSRQISAVLDVEDVISEAYRLEVGSPGIDRPLIKESDYTKYAGHAAKIETVLPINGRKRFNGPLKGFEDGNIIIAVDNKEVKLPFRDIQSAKLVLTDALIKAHQARLAS